MGITSFCFLCFYVLLLTAYYIVPFRMRWIVLAVATVCFFLLTDEPALIVFPVAAALLTHAAASSLAKKKSATVLGTYLILMFGVLFAMKALKLLHPDDVVMPLGLSFYTFIMTGHVIDVYNGIAEPFAHIGQTFLAGAFFPVMVSGPIYRLRESGEQFFEERKLNYRNLTFGLQRMVWGFFQKLVISERLSVVVTTIYANPDTYAGAWIWLAAVCFSFQLYTDFSGAMDIVLGMAETFGLTLPENFRAPFLATSISEFWRRWHITLGAWMRDNVFYPLLRSRPFANLSARWKQAFGKKRGNRYVNYLAMLVLWTAVGFWHGGELKYVIGVGVLHWFYIVCGECLQPVWKKTVNVLHLPPGGALGNAFRVVRTFLLVTIGLVFFRAESVSHALRLLSGSVRVWNPGQLFTSALFETGLNWTEWGVLAVSLVLLVVVNLFRYGITGEQTESTHAVRERIARKPVAVRWTVWMLLLFYVILLGKYGPDFRTADFIYKGF